MTFDIESRMRQWDAANRAQHTREIGPILTSETPEKTADDQPAPSPDQG